LTARRGGQYPRREPWGISTSTDLRVKGWGGGPSGDRCLVLGGGFLGSHVAHVLAAEGREVTLFTRSVNPWLTADRADGIRIHLGRIESDADLLGELVDEADVVVHLASSSRPPEAMRAPALDVEQTVIPALAVLQTMSTADHGKLLLVCSSGGTVYGRPLQLPTPEEHPLRPLTPYAISHAAVEGYVDFYRQLHGVQAVTLRFANVYGPGELGRGGQGVIGTWLRQIVIGERPVLLGHATVARDFLYVDDAARAVSALIGTAAPRAVYNVGSGTSVSISEVLHVVREVTGYPLEPTLGSAAPGAPLPQIPATCLDISRLCADSGWRPERSLAEGVSLAWAWANGHWGSTRAPTERALHEPEH
jgi:UDP-glucose 4-epimerase